MLTRFQMLSVSDHFTTLRSKGLSQNFSFLPEESSRNMFFEMFFNSFMNEVPIIKKPVHCFAAKINGLVYI